MSSACTRPPAPLAAIPATTLPIVWLSGRSRGSLSRSACAAGLRDGSERCVVDLWGSPLCTSGRSSFSPLPSRSSPTRKVQGSFQGKRPAGLRPAHPGHRRATPIPRPLPRDAERLGRRAVGEGWGEGWWERGARRAVGEGWGGWERGARSRRAVGEGWGVRWESTPVGESARRAACEAHHAV